MIVLVGIWVRLNFVLRGGIRMPVCSFCKNGYEFPKGTTVVQKDSSVRYYCSSKCRKNMEMGRLTKKVKWIRKSDVVKDEKAKYAASKSKS